MNSNCYPGIDQSLSEARYVMNFNHFKINSSPKASLSDTGTVLFSPRSKELRLRTEVPCSWAAQPREKIAFIRISHEEFRDNYGIGGQNEKERRQFGH